MLQTAESFLTADKKAATNLTTGPGAGGAGTAVYVGYGALIPFSLCYPTTSETSSSGLSSISIGRLDWDAGGRPKGESSRASGREYSAQNRKQPGCGVLEPYRGQPPAPQGISANMRPFVRSWLKACDNGDPPKRKQKAATPQLLRVMFEQSGAGTESRKGHTRGNQSLS